MVHLDWSTDVRILYVNERQLWCYVKVLVYVSRVSCTREKIIVCTFVCTCGDNSYAKATGCSLTPIK